MVNMKTKRNPNKRRWKGSYDLCPCCYHPHCDPMMSYTYSPWAKKLRFRLKNKLCVSCGKNPCECKRRKYPSNVE